MSYTLEEYGNIVLTVLNKYYLKLFRRYKDLVAKRTGTKVAAQWSNDEVVHQILVDLFLESDTENISELLKKEAVEELRLKKDKMFDGDDLIFDHRTLEGLGNLYNSLVCSLKESLF